MKLITLRLPDAPGCGQKCIQLFSVEHEGAEKFAYSITSLAIMAFFALKRDAASGVLLEEIGLRVDGLEAQAFFAPAAVCPPGVGINRNQRINPMQSRTSPWSVVSCKGFHCAHQC